MQNTQGTQKKLVCIVCPLGCNLSITQNGDEYSVSGNKCPRGKNYAISELTAPKRIVTTTVKIKNSIYPVIPVKTATPIPKEKIFDILKILKTIEVEAPKKIGDIVVKNILGTKVDIVVTKSMDKL